MLTSHGLPAPHPWLQVAPPVVFPEAFGVDRHRLRLRAGASEKLKASFLPFKLGEHRATVMFADLDCGEFCYELVGDVGMPAIFLDHKATVGLDGVQVRDLGAIQHCWINRARHSASDSIGSTRSIFQVPTHRCRLHALSL